MGARTTDRFIRRGPGERRTVLLPKRIVPHLPLSDQRSTCDKGMHIPVDIALAKLG